MDSRFDVDRRDRLDSPSQRGFLPKLIYVGVWISEGGTCHDKKDSRDSCAGAISDGAASSNHKYTIHDVLSDVLAAIPAMRCQQYSLLQNI